MQHRIIDTHVHAWNFDKAKYSWLDGDTTILNRTYNIEELEEERVEAGVTDGILVQAANNFEDTDWMLEIAAKNEWIKGVVGWLPLMYPDNTAVALDEYKSNRYFKGVRHLIHDEKDPRWLLQEEVLESLRVLASNNIPFDLVGVLPVHIETALRVAEKVPSLKMVFDHLNQPPIAERTRYGQWGELITEAAKHPNFYAKISGLGTTSKKQDLSGEDIEPYFALIIEHFGENRCFCGGDWPVSLLAGSYSETWKIYKEAIERLVDEKVRNRIYFSNATDFYQIAL
jgi:L-fuconolactonase